MEMGKREAKNSHRIQTRPIIMLLIGLGFLTLILLATMLAAASDIKKPAKSRLQNTGDQVAMNEESEEMKAAGNEIIAIVENIDFDNRLITLYDVIKREQIHLSYTGGTNITDKYGQIIAMSQIEQGTMVDAEYNPELTKLTDMKLSTKAWEYIGVSNLDIDPNLGMMKIASSKYRYYDDIMVLNGEELISVSDLAPQDELTIRGYEEMIWSITVTRGHGTVILTEYERFLGAGITIGYESMQQITEGMEIIVREGNFNLTVENGNYIATKSITVNRNQVTYASLGDLGPEAPQQGRVTFDITPYGADLIVDGELLSYSTPIELTYGEHSLSVSLGGYQSYYGTLVVDGIGKTLRIDLPENSAPETPAAEETESDSTQVADYTEEQEPDSRESEDLTIDEEHFIYVQNPIRASVYLNGDFMCISPGNFPKIIGTHVITFIEEGYQTKSYTIEIADDGLDAYLTFPDLEAK